mgnify:CR=1 FL=1
MNYLSIYHNLCSSRSQLKERWGKNSGLHRHHILPKHVGGLDEETNYTYLTVKEHVLAHRLLWKIYKNPNDLRSMQMLGANLTIEQRRQIGLFCRDNNLGFFKASKEDKRKWRLKGLETQKVSGDTNSFYFWSTFEGRKKRASMGGSVGGKKQAELGLGFHNPEIRKKACSMGGKSHIGKIWIHKGDKKTRIQKDNLESYLNEGWLLGSGSYKDKKKKSG